MAVNIISILVIVVILSLFVVNYTGEHKSLISCFNYKKCTGATLAVVLIVMGVLVNNQRSDLFSYHPLNKSQAIGLLGTASFVIGWLLLAWLVIPTDYVADKDNSDKYHTENNLKQNKMNWYAPVSATLVMVAGLVLHYYTSQTNINQNTKALTWVAVAFVVAWIGFGVLLGWKDGEYRPDKLVMSLPGSILVVLGMIVLFTTRKMNIFDGGKLNGPGYVYGPGLVLFTLGWVLVIGSIGKVDEKSEVCGT